MTTLKQPGKPTDQLAKFNVPKAEIEKLLKDSENMVIVDSNSHVAVKKTRANIQKVITAIEVKRKEIKAPFLDKAKQIDEIAKELSGPLEERKSELYSTIKVYETKKADEKAEKERIKQEKLQKIRDKIQVWRDLYEYNPEESIERLRQNVEDIKAKEFPKKEYGDLVLDAERERGILLGQLGNILTLKKEAEARRIEQEEQIMREKEALLAKELADAREQFKDVFGADAPGDLDIEALKAAISKKIQELKAELAATPQVPDERGDSKIKKMPPLPHKPIVVKKDTEKTSVELGKELIEDADKAQIKEEVEIQKEKLLNNNGLLPDLPFKSEYWKKFYGDFCISLQEVIVLRLDEMLDQVK